MADVKFKIGQVEIEVSSEDVSKAIEAGELTLVSDKLIEKNEDTIVYNKVDFDTYTENIKKEEYKATKTKAEEMAMKSIKNEFGFDIEGYKDVKTFATTLKDEIIKDAKIDPSKKIQDLENDLKTVQDNFKNKETELIEFKQGVTQKETRAKKDVFLTGLIPTEGIKITPDISLTILKSKGIDVNFTDNGTEVTYNGEVIKDPSTLEPTDGKEFISNKLKELDLFSKPSGGGGGGDEPGGGGKAGSYEAFVKELKAQDIEEGTSKFSEEMNKRITDKTLVM